MQRISSDLFFSPSDLNHFVECEHLTALDLLAVDGHGLRKEKDPQAEIIRAKGLEHEQAWLRRLVAEGRQVVSIADADDTDWARDAARTEQAMRDGAEVIYQGVFVDAPWRGIADFLTRVNVPSRLGGWSYEASDAKLARHPKPYFILQLCWYSEQLERLQGVPPARMHVVLGTGETVSFAPARLPRRTTAASAPGSCVRSRSGARRIRRRWGTATSAATHRTASSSARRTIT